MIVANTILPGRKFLAQFCSSSMQIRSMMLLPSSTKINMETERRSSRSPALRRAGLSTRSTWGKSASTSRFRSHCPCSRGAETKYAFHLSVLQTYFEGFRHLRPASLGTLVFMARMVSTFILNTRQVWLATAFHLVP